MGDINLTKDEFEAIRCVDDELLRKLIEECLQEQRIYRLRALQIERCGDFVAYRLREYEKALYDLEKAKAPKKVAEIESRARRAGGNLESAIAQMKDRAEKEQEERQLFFIDDLIMPPNRFDEHLSVRISYRWRKAEADDWAYGVVTFTHELVEQPDCSISPPRRKRSAAQKERERQEKLWYVWGHLKNLGLWSVREFFKEGGNGADIPMIFKALEGSYHGGLNNHSAKFWSP